MRYPSFKAGLFPHFLFLLLLSLLQFVFSAPVTIQPRGGGPQICGKALKINKYRNVCFGENGVYQPGVAAMAGGNSLVWQDSSSMENTMDRLGTAKSSVHCDHVLEVQFIKNKLKAFGDELCTVFQQEVQFFSQLQNVINGKQNLLFLDGEINMLKGRYTTRVMTATRKKVTPILPVVKDARLAQGLTRYFTKIQSYQLSVAQEIDNLLKPYILKYELEEVSIEAETAKDFAILNNFFRTWSGKLSSQQAATLPDWAEASGGGPIQPDASFDLELEQAFAEADADEDEPMTPSQIQDLRNNAEKASSTDLPRKSPRLQCKRLANEGGTAGGEEEATDGLSCQLPNSNSQVGSQVNEDSNPTRGATTPQSPALDSEPINDEGNLAAPNSRLPPPSTLRSSPIPTQPLALSNSRLNNLAFTSPTSILTSPHFYPTSRLYTPSVHTSIPKQINPIYSKPRTWFASNFSPPKSINRPQLGAGLLGGSGAGYGLKATPTRKILSVNTLVSKGGLRRPFA